MGGLAFLSIIILALLKEPIVQERIKYDPSKDKKEQILEIVERKKEEE